MKKAVQQEWITSQRAAEILSEKCGRTISDAYVRRLGSLGKITTMSIDKRTKLYLCSDAEHYTVQPRGTGEVRRALREKKGIAYDEQQV